MTTSLPSASQTVTQSSIHTYADLSGDYNPLHVDEEFAAKTPFGGTIAHGPIALQTLFVALSEWCGSEGLPAGVGLKVTYRAPVRPGDTITFVPLSVEEGESGLLAVEGECRNQREETVITVSVTAPKAVVRE